MASTSSGKTRRFGLPGRTAVVLSLAFAAVTVIAPRAEAQTAFWTGVSGTLWSAASGTNWSSTAASPGTPTVPVNGNSLRWFNNSPNKTSFNDLTGLSVAGMSFQSATGPIVLNGNKLTLTGNISAVPTNVTLDLPLELNANQAMDGSTNGSLTINGNITEIGGSRTLNIQSGTVAFNGTNSYSGNMILGVAGNAVLTINSLAIIGVAQALGTGTTVVFGHTSGNGTIIYTGSTASTDKRFQIGRSGAGATGVGAFRNNGTGAVTLTGAQTLAPSNNVSLVFTLGGSNTDDNTWQSTIANNSATGLIGITKTDAGKWILSGANTYDGATTVSAGELLVNGNQSGAIGAVSVAANAILGGTGTIGGASAAITGTLAPGLSGSLGTLTFAGSAMNFSTGGSLLAQLNSNPAVFTSDLLAISGAGSLTLGGSSILDLVGPSSFTTSGTYTLATFASGSSINQFTTVRYNGQTFGSPTTTGGVNTNGTLVYNANSLQLVVVPEPGTLALAGLGVGLAGITAWKRRRVRG